MSPSPDRWSDRFQDPARRARKAADLTTDAMTRLLEEAYPRDEQVTMATSDRLLASRVS
jgi:hypothetical protein